MSIRVINQVDWTSCGWPFPLLFSALYRDAEGSVSFLQTCILQGAIDGNAMSHASSELFKFRESFQCGFGTLPRLWPEMCKAEDHCSHADTR